jgi:Methylamine utilisation protein MauE
LVDPVIPLVSEVKRFAVSAVRIALAVCLLASSWFHLSNPYAFVADIHNYGLTPASASVLLAAVLPYLQIGLAACLLVPTCSQIASLFCSLLFLTYFSAQVIALMQGNETSCGCFGGFSERISFWTIGLAALLFLLAVFGYRHGNLDDPGRTGEVASSC